MKYFLNISGIFDADWDFPYKNNLKRFSIFRISENYFFRILTCASGPPTRYRGTAVWYRYQYPLSMAMYDVWRVVQQGGVGCADAPPRNLANRPRP